MIDPKESKIEWVRVRDLVVLRMDTEKDASYGFKTAPRKRFTTEARPMVRVATNQDHYGIVVDKYRMSERWGNSRNHISWIYHIMLGDVILFIKDRDWLNKYGLKFTLQKVQREDDRKDLSSNPDCYPDS